MKTHRNAQRVMKYSLLFGKDVRCTEEEPWDIHVYHNIGEIALFFPEIMRDEIQNLTYEAQIRFASRSEIDEFCDALGRDSMFEKENRYIVSGNKVTPLFWTANGAFKMPVNYFTDKQVCRLKKALYAVVEECVLREGIDCAEFGAYVILLYQQKISGEEFLNKVRESKEKLEKLKTRLAD